jgi:hypothetical protein
MRRGAAGLLLGLVLAVGSPRPALPSTELAISHQSRVSLNGTTNVNSWRCSGDSLGGGAAVTASPTDLSQLLAEWEARPSGSRLDSPAESPELWRATLELRIPVAALDCANRPMERDLRRALRAAAYPEIRYRFRRLREAWFTPAGSVSSFTLVAEGDLTLAGETRPVAITVTATRQGQLFRLRGNLPLQMSDFGIQPPVALLGLIRARDELWVSVDLELTAPATQKPPS